MIYHVKFDGTDKLYAYYCEPHIELKIGSSYMIEADRVTNYKNPITVMRIDNNVPKNVNVRTITQARPLNGTKRPDDKIKQVIFNKEKRTTVVLWCDGQKTIIKCQDGDVWDEEKALALCKKGERMKTYYLVSETNFKSILEDVLKFRALESGGVDNWKWYGASLGDFLKERIRKFEPNLDEDDEDFSFADIVNSELKYFKKIIVESED